MESILRFIRACRAEDQTRLVAHHLVTIVIQILNRAILTALAVMMALIHVSTQTIPHHSSSQGDLLTWMDLGIKC